MWFLVFVTLFFGTLIFLNVRRNKPSDTVEDIKVSYVGIETQQRRNKHSTIAMLAVYPLLVAGLAFLLLGILSIFLGALMTTDSAVMIWVGVIFLAIILWTGISYFCYASTIRNETKLKPIDRNDDPRVYNILENLCIACGMNKIPILCVMEDESLNAFASGIKEVDYTVTLTSGLINNLTDEELEGVIAHELAHIRNGDVKLMTLSMVLNSIFANVSGAIREVSTKIARYFRRLMTSRDIGVKIVGLVGMMQSLIIGLMFWTFASILTACSTLMHFTISRKREFLADAGAVNITQKPSSLASALRKISGNDYVAMVKNADVASMFISNPCVNLSEEETITKKMQYSLKRFFFIDELTRTHPDIRVRIKVLEQF